MNDRISKTESSSGTLFVVATPIGNLGDISYRAVKILSEVETVLAEDTRHSKKLFNHYGISTRLRSCHEHNEERLVDWVVNCLRAGQDIALISDAGTPLISDPGFVLVRALRSRGCQICVVPGASSVIAALSVAGLATDRFIFDGFLAPRAPARRSQLTQYDDQPRTIVLLESSHRIVACMQDIVDVLGADRRVAVARELTKKFETMLAGRADEVLVMLHEDEDQTRGEFVVMLEGAPVLAGDQADIQATLKILMAELPLKQASNLTAKLTGSRKNDVYAIALSLKSEDAELQPE